MEQHQLTILYEDNHLIVVKKPYGLLTQADISKDIDLLSLVRQYIKEKYDKPGNVFLGMVHRLDRNTQGVLVFAKTSKAARRLSLDIRLHNWVKKYRAIIRGAINPTEARLVSYLHKDERQNKSFPGSGKEAILEYHTIEYIDGNTLIDINLITGRHHQIRCMFAERGHPLVGDAKYGDVGNDGYFLECYSIEIIHPITKEKMTFSI